MRLALLVLLGVMAPPPLTGPWTAALDLAAGTLPFAIQIEQREGTWHAQLCNGTVCQPFTAVHVVGDSVTLEMADYAATITAVARKDSLVGSYRNVGNRGPRTIPFRAARGTYAVTKAPAALLGSWDATFFTDWGTSPRILVFGEDAGGVSGTIVSNSGDYGHFAGTATADSFAIAHFDGSFVYLLTGRLDGDTLRGTFHAGLRSQTAWKAVRSSGAPHLKPPDQVTSADTTTPFRFSFPDLDGHIVTSDDPRFRGKVVLVDIFGTWCPTCHDAAPLLGDLYRQYHDQGLEIVGLAYEVTGDSATDGRQVRRFRDKFNIAYPLLLAGTNATDAAAATLPQLTDFTAFPTTIFLGRDGRARRIHAGFYGPATGAQYARLAEEFRAEVERLLSEPE